MEPGKTGGGGGGGGGDEMQREILREYIYAFYHALYEYCLLILVYFVYISLIGDYVYDRILYLKFCLSKCM